MQIVVPEGDRHQTVKVVEIGSDGSPRIVYEGVHTPGETVTTQAAGVAPLFVQIYVAGVMVKQIAVPAQAR
jgi:serine/threonine-protein kinase